jgi:uncharacterized caspase-like protein
MIAASEGRRKEGSMRCVVRGLVLLALCCAIVALQAQMALAEKRVALVIGNGKYVHGGVLPNVPNDAEAIGALFRAAKFDVDVRHNLGAADLRAAVRKLSEKAADADVVALFYAGHGMEVGQANYLLPVDERLATAFDIEDETMSLERVLQAMTPARRLRLVILDACRANPFLNSTVATRTVGNGLAHVEPTTPDTLIAFATKPNSIAADGRGRNSPFTTALVKHLFTPGLDLRIALGHVRDEVLASTDRKQEPYVTSSLGGGTITLAPAVAAAPLPPMNEAERAWTAVRDTSSIAQLEVIANRFKGTVYADLARARIEELREAPRKQGAVVPPISQPTPLPPNSAKQSMAPAERLLAIGSRRLEQGNVSAAREFFLRAADAGSAEAALALGTTYDPAEQANLSWLGVVPDGDEARKWYQRARELGSLEAAVRLARLGQ